MWLEGLRGESDTPVSRTRKVSKVESDSVSRTDTTAYQVVTSTISTTSRAVQTASYLGALQIKFSINNLDTNLTTLFLSYLDLNSSGRCLLVNKKWNECSNHALIWDKFDVTKIYPQTMFFFKANWQACFYPPEVETNEGLPPSKQDESNEVMPRKINVKNPFIPTWNRLCTRTSLIPIEENLGFSCLTMPSGLNLNKLLEFAKKCFI